MTQHIPIADIDKYFANLRKSGKRNRQIVFNRITKYFRVFNHASISLARLKNEELHDYLAQWKAKSYIVEAHTQEDTVEWINLNLVGLWYTIRGAYFASNVPDVYFFENEDDAFLFKMRWG